MAEAILKYLRSMALPLLETAGLVVGGIASMLSGAAEWSSADGNESEWIWAAA